MHPLALAYLGLCAPIWLPMAWGFAWTSTLAHLAKAGR